MHSKQKGNIAFSSVVLELQKHEFNVFSEIGDYSRIDLIAEKNNILKKIQIKFSGESEEKMVLNLEKSGPNGYRYNYSEKDVDWFAIYSPYADKIAWVKATEACPHSRQFIIRIKEPKNKQTQNLHMLEDYGVDKFELDFEMAP